MTNAKNSVIAMGPNGRKQDQAGRGFYSTAMAGRKSKATLPDRPTSSQQFNEMKEQLGMFDKMAINRRSRTEARRVLAEIVVNSLEKQKQLILFQKTLELADEKKRLFAESLREAALVEKEIAERSTEHEEALIDFVVDTAMEGQQKKERRLRLLDQQLAAGQITQDTYFQEAERIQRWATIYLDNIDGKVELMLQNHARLIERALALFNERSIPGVTL